MPSIPAQSRPSAISLMVKSNSLRATKSIGAPCSRLSSGCTATLAPTKPIFSAGFASFSAAATFTSEAKDGVEVWIMHSSCCRAASQHRRQADARRRRVDQLAARHQRGRLGQPGRVPEAADFPLRLVARAGAAVEPVEGRGLQEKRFHHGGHRSFEVRRLPIRACGARKDYDGRSASSVCPRQFTVSPA